MAMLEARDVICTALDLLGADALEVRVRLERPVVARRELDYDRGLEINRSKTPEIAMWRLLKRVRRGWSRVPMVIPACRSRSASGMGATTKV